MKSAVFVGNSNELDQFDLLMLRLLCEVGRISITDLAEKIGLSKTPTQTRFMRLQKLGYIEGFSALINPSKLGLEHVAFAEVKLLSTKEEALQAFNQGVRKIPEVEECHMIAGRFDYLLKIRTKDIRRYRQVLGEQITQLPFVASTSTNVAMEIVVDRWNAAGRL